MSSQEWVKFGARASHHVTGDACLIYLLSYGEEIRKRQWKIKSTKVLMMAAFPTVMTMA